MLQTLKMLEMLQTLKILAVPKLQRGWIDRKIVQVLPRSGQRYSEGA